MFDRSLVFGSLLLAAYIMAQTFGALAGAALLPPLAIPEPVPIEPALRPMQDTSALLERNLFGARRISIAPQQVCRAEPSLRLVATVIGMEGSVAWFDRGGDLVPAWIGDRIDGAEVIAVDRGSVRLAKEGACAEVAIAELDPAPATSRQASLVRRMSDLEVEVSRSDLEAAISDPMRFARDARIVPKPGQGFALHAIKPGGIVDQLGFTNGDVLEQLNGHRLDEPRSWFSPSELIRGSELTIDYTRRGERRTLTVRID